MQITHYQYDCSAKYPMFPAYNFLFLFSSTAPYKEPEVFYLLRLYLSLHLFFYAIFHNILRSLNK